MEKNKSISNEQLAEIKRLLIGRTTTEDAIARMYGLTIIELDQIKARLSAQ